MGLGFQELENIWFYYLSLEADMEKTEDYVEPYLQEKVYSFEFYKIILLSCCEIESIFKILYKELKGKEAGDIGKYKEAVLGRFPHIVEARVIVPRWRAKNIRPFSGWDSSPLEWWSVYQRIKHSRGYNYKDATYENAAYALSALYILILYLYYLSGYECKADDAKYIESTYYHHPIDGKDYERLPDTEER